MTSICWLCGRPLTRPTPDGLGPVCRRKLQPGGPAVDGQLAIPVPLPRAVRARWLPVWRGRRVDNVPTHGLL